MLRNRGIISEFIRYVFVGGISFLADFFALYVFHELIIPDMPYSLYISVVIGFLVGVVVNYILSLKFVFISVKETSLGKGTRDKVLFVIIGLIGLALNEVGMFTGTELLYIDYRIVKVIVAGIVMVWNYIARKLLIFNVKLLKS